MEQFARSLRAVLDHVARQRAALTLAAKAIGHARDRCRGLRSSHPLVGQAVAGFDAAVERLREADRLLAQTGEALGEYATAIGISLGDATSPPSTPDTEATAARREPAAPWPPPFWIRMAGRRLPDRPGDQGPTRGYAFDANGDPLFDEVLVSARNVASTAGLRPIPGLGKGWPWTLTDHVEARVAARMREPGGPREVTLVLNQAPCVDDPYGCDRMLRHVIPSGSRVTVYVKSSASPDGVRLHDVHSGTGKGVAP